MLSYLKKIKVRPYFKKIIPLLVAHGAGPVVLSDDFHFVIDTILHSNGIKGITVCANRLRFCDDRLIPAFPHTNLRCWKCGHCKTKNLKKRGIGSKIIIYIGDGRSDICPAKKADLVFAKGSLLKYFRQNRLECKPFKDLKEVYNYFKRIYDAEPKDR